MYLYIPINGRSIVVGEYIISSTGLQLDTLIACLEEQLGKTLKREGVEVIKPTTLELVAPKIEIPAMPQTEENPKI